MFFAEAIKGEYPLYIVHHLNFITTMSVKNQCRNQTYDPRVISVWRFFQMFCLYLIPLKEIILFFYSWGILFIVGISLISSVTPYFCDILQCIKKKKNMYNLLIFLSTDNKTTQNLEQKLVFAKEKHHQFLLCFQWYIMFISFSSC